MKYLTNYVPQGGGMSDGYVAVEENGELKLQKLSFNGTEATPEGATETMLEVGLFPTGMDEPAYAGSGGGSAKYYKCATVDTTAKTWTGYGVTITEDGFTFEETVTSDDLVYDRISPIIGGVYPADCSYVVSNYKVLGFAAPIYYAALTDSLDTTLGTLNSYNTNYTLGAMYQNKKCVYLNATYLYQDFGLLTGNLPYTLSLWANLNDTKWSGLVTAGERGSNWSTVNTGFGVTESSKTLYAMYGYDSNYNPALPDYDFVFDQWHHVVMSYDGSKVKFYLDGVFKSEIECSDINLTNQEIFIGHNIATVDADHRLVGYITNVQVYDYAMSDGDITNILYAQEYRP